MRSWSLFPLLAAAGLSLAGCQGLFTTSLASVLARKSLSVPDNLSTSQATQLAAEAKANADPALASALVDSLNLRIAESTNPSEREEFMAAAASAAVTASQAGGTLMTVFQDVTSGSAPSDSAISAVVQSIQDGATDSVVAALSYLQDVDTETAAAAGFGGTDYYVAAAVLAASILEDAGVDLAPTEDNQADIRAAIQAAATADTTGALQAQIDTALDLSQAGAALLTAQENPLAADLQAQFEAFFLTPAP
ncbi:MAG: hypothetical protein Q8M76_01740 [Spirochaetaceae bacterium]|nr:hypothetical protein [Spirochaetaceae bacterium]